MVRLKFFLFALIVLALGLAHLLLVSNTFSRPAIDSARTQAVGGTSQLAQWVAARRAALQDPALGAVGASELKEAVQALRTGKPGDPAVVAKVNALRTFLQGRAPEALRSGLVIGLAAESGAVHVRGQGEPTAEGLDVQALAGVGTAGGLRDAFGAPHVFVALPTTGGSPDQPVAVLGAPLFLEGSRASGSAVVALLAGDSLTLVPGADAAAVERARRALKGGQTEVVERGGVAKLGPLELPVLTRPGDVSGGAAPLSVGSRQLFEGSPYEVFSLVSVRPTMGALAQYQSLALMGLGGLLLLSFVWTLVMGSSQAAARKEAPADSSEPEALEPATRVESSLGGEDPGSALPVAGPPPAAGSTPDDFPFGLPSSPPARPAPPVEAPDDAFPSAPAEQQEAGPTAAYSLSQAADPFALASAGYPPEEESDEQTRVAAIPQELLQASAAPYSDFAAAAAPGPAAQQPPRVSNAAVAVPLPPTSSPSYGNSAVVTDDQHFQDVFRDFMATREKCGEPADGLTFDKFVVKLRKNREQLVQKYSCKTVRFQVYVKEGKAALKATPVKE